NNNFEFAVHDICGRPPFKAKVNYAVKGDEGDPCNRIACGDNGGAGKDNLVCSRPNSTTVIPSTCVDVSALNNTCTGGTVGSPPTSGCPDVGLFNCNYTALCLRSDTHGEAEDCTSGQKENDACSFHARGTCNGSTCEISPSSCPSGMSCSGAPEAFLAGKICGSPGVVDGDQCYFQASSTCGPVSGSCPKRDAGPTNVPSGLGAPLSNPNCEIRPEYCFGGTPTTLPNPCTGPNRYLIPGDCQFAANPNTQWCTLNGSCYDLISCSTGFSSYGVCMSQRPNPDHEVCVPGNPDPPCSKVFSCGARWSNYGSCMDPAKGNCQGTCTPTLEGCYECQASTTTTTTSTSSSFSTSSVTNTSFTTTTNTTECPNPPTFPTRANCEDGTACLHMSGTNCQEGPVGSHCWRCPLSPPACSNPFSEIIVNTPMIILGHCNPTPTAPNCNTELDQAEDAICSGYSGPCTSSLGCPGQKVCIPSCGISGDQSGSEWWVECALEVRCMN
ncbi:MAG: hypothetical protein KDD25_06035, partial [Bdellovibrionales bacterium]|nr:hypothetical protein [Bdellovibrionales bacterium]